MYVSRRHLKGAKHSCGRGDRGLSALAACCSVCTMHMCFTYKLSELQQDIPFHVEESKIARL